MAIDEAIYREASEPLRRFLIMAAAYTVMALLLGVCVPFAYMMSGSGYSRSATGRVIAEEKLGGEGRRLLTIEFRGVDGELHTTREGERSDEPLHVGDTVPVLFNPDNYIARSVNLGERALRTVFIALGAILLALSALVVLLGIRQRARRRWLLRHGRVEQGLDPRVTWHSVAIATQLPPSWRLNAAWFDPSAATWRTVGSAKQASLQWEPRPDAALVHIYVDPQRPERAWLPVAHLRAPVLKG